MRNPPDSHAESHNRLLDEPTSHRSLHAPEVVPVDLSSSPAHPDERLPFAPGGETVAVDNGSVRTLAAALAESRWRRPVMIVLALAVATSVGLAARRSVTVDAEGRTSGGIGAPQIVGDGVGTADSNAGDGLAMAAEVVGGATDENDPPAQSPSPLKVTSPSVPTTDDTTVTTGGSSTGRSIESTSTTADSSSSTTARPVTSQTPATTATTKTTSPATTRRTTTTRSATTTSPPTTSPTTTTAPTTAPPPPTTVVLVGRSAGGFESPSIRQDMVWLDNGEVDRWRSTNGDIQLMRSGFEGISSIDGGQFAELNSSSQGGLYRSLTVESGAVVEWEFLHRARSGTETIEVRIGPQSDVDVVDTVTATTTWVTHSGRWRVPDGITSVRFMLWSTRSGPYGNLVDAVRVVSVEG